MNTNTAPGNTRHTATLFERSQNVSRHTMSSREIAELTGSTHDNVLKTIRALVAKGVVSSNDTPYVHPQSSDRAAFQPLVTPKGLTYLAEKNIGASL